MATLGLTPDQQKAVEEFRRNVVDPSMTSLVVLDFWAEWCGPCKQLTPVLEKVAATYADKGVVLVKVNVDENPFIAAQFQVQSIPTVFAIFQGQPVANLTNARTEGQLSQMLDQILRQLPIESAASRQAADLAPLLAMGNEVLDGGDAARALGIFSQIADMAPDNAQALGGLIRAQVASGDVAGARTTADAVPEAASKDAHVRRAISALELAEAAPAGGADLSALETQVAGNADDHAARFDLASALAAQGQRDAAADHLLHIVAADRDWNDGAARAKFLAMLEAVGLEDPWAAAQRRRLSAILFG